ncbi:MAG: flagellar motor switch protein FliM [Planctomycetota bacterium]|nr:MAG: flagellar motor switch protein FliM [Planctomycetota bacterium]
MAEESLERDDVEDLLKSMDAGEKRTPPKGPADGASAGTPPTGQPGTSRQRIVAYDFKRPERVGKEQMRALQSVHEGFARNLGASYSALLRTIVESKLISVDQLTYSEFVYSLEIPTCFNVLRPAPLEGNWILDFSPAVLYPIIDRLLGGTPSEDSMLKRPLSEIELRLASRITNALLRDLQAAWKNAVELNIELERVESNPRLVQIVPPNEVVVLISFELTMGKARGMVNLCIPFNSIERIGSRLTANNWMGYASSRASEVTQKQLSNLLSESVVEMVVTMARTTINTVDLLNLQVGDIITTDKDVREPLEVEVAGVGKFHCRAGAFKSKKAVEILGPIAKSSSGEAQTASEKAGNPAASDAPAGQAVPGPHAASQVKSS